MLSAVTWKLAQQQTLSSLKLSEWRALVIALIIAIAIASLMAVLGERIERTLMRQGSALVGADLVLSNSRPLAAENLKTATALGLTSTSVTQLATMANSGEQFLLVTVRALAAPYPRGTIELEQDLKNHLPNPGEAWAEAGVYERLNLKPGDRITLGKQQFTLTASIRSAPDRGRGFISFNPQLIINQAELESTGLLGPGARLRYRQLFAGPPQQLEALHTLLNAQLETGERLTALSDQEGQSGSALNKASSYLRLGALFALIIAGMTIFLSLRRFTQSQNKRAALLKTLGLSDRQLLRLYLMQFTLAWLFCSLIGIGLALLMEQIGLHLLQTLLPQAIPAANGVVYLSGPLLGGLILFCLSLPSLLRLQQSHPIQLFQGQDSALHWGSNLPYLIAFLLLVILTGLYLDNLLLTLSLVCTLFLLGSALGWLGAQSVQHLVRRFAHHHSLGSLLLSRVQQQQRWYRIQIPVISLLFALLSINLIALNDLLSRWQEQLPANTPDHFLINIQEWEKEEVTSLLHAQQLTPQLWPIYRGRLVQVNGKPLAEALTPEQLQQPSLKRELNLTSASAIPAHNQLLKGSWQQEGAVSIEEKEAAELGLTLGDEISFDIGGELVSARISSIRRVQWDSFQPNFYFIFSPERLESLSASYMTSFYLGDKSAALSRELISQFPTLTLIDVRQLLDQIQQLLSRLSLLSSLLMLLTTTAGLVLLYVTLTQELEQRRYENALLQTMGASNRQCQQLNRLEMGCVGAISGLLAVIITEISLWPIHQQLLKLEPVIHPGLWIALPLISAVLFITVSMLSHRQQSLDKNYRFLLSRQ